MFEYKGLKIKFHPKVYEPSDDTFLLAKVLENIIPKLSANSEVLEIGTGTGIIAVLLAKKAKHVTATDINQHALNLARENADQNGIKNIDFIYSDLFEKIKSNKNFDLIVFNTPYLRSDETDEIADKELSKAWKGGDSGREIIEKFLNESIKHLKLKGMLVLVESSLSDYKKTLNFFKKHKFTAKVVAFQKFDFEEIVVIEASASTLSMQATDFGAGRRNSR